MKAVIMAGGKGSRIKSVAPDIPKPMIKISGKPVLEWEICSLKEQGFRDIIITVSHLSECITEYFGDGHIWDVNIEYFKEEIPLGNAGALFRLRDKLGTSPFLLLNADSMYDVDFARLIKFHSQHNALVTLFSHPNNHPYDSSLIVADENGCVIDWINKDEERPQWYKNRVNAGIHVIDPSVLDNKEILAGIPNLNDEEYKVDLDRQIIKPLCRQKKVYCYDSPEYIKDMGTPDRLASVTNDFLKGIINSKNLKNKQKAIFLDRDGTINKYVGFLRSINDFELIDGVAEAIRKINGNGYLTIVVTNQPVIARGEVTESELTEIHNKMETLLGAEGAYVDAIYYCPHHPDKGYVGEIEALKIICNCRKPKPGLLIRAMEDFNIDLANSWMIGDGENDVIAGKNAGCKTVLIGSGEYGQDVTVNSLIEFVRSHFPEE